MHDNEILVMSEGISAVYVLSIFFSSFILKKSSNSHLSLTEKERVLAK